MDKLVLALAAVAGGLLTLLALKRLATLGDRKWAARRTRVGAQTPAYLAPARWWTDEHGRPW